MKTIAMICLGFILWASGFFIGLSCGFYIFTQ